MQYYPEDNVLLWFGLSGTSRCTSTVRPGQPAPMAGRVRRDGAQWCSVSLWPLLKESSPTGHSTLITVPLLLDFFFKIILTPNMSSPAVPTLAEAPETSLGLYRVFVMAIRIRKLGGRGGGVWWGHFQGKYNAGLGGNGRRRPWGLTFQSHFQSVIAELFFLFFF